MKPNWIAPSVTASLLAMLSLPATALVAQDTVGEDDDDVVVLNPFVVDASGDDRYYASNAISGTQLNVQIKDIPFNLEVITSEFMQDTAATDFKESLAFSSGIFTQTYVDNSGANPSGANATPSEQAPVGSRLNNAIIIRGMTAPYQQRMGFRVGAYIGLRGRSSGLGSSGSGGITLGSLIDTVNIDRNEVVRGPANLLYGLGALSGIVNVLPKRPLGDPRYEVTFSAGNYDFYRATFDATGPLIKGKDGREILNYRFLGAWQENEEWYDYFSEERDYLAFQLQWMPIKGLQIFGEIAQGNRHLNAHQGANPSGGGEYLRMARGGWMSPPPQRKGFVNAFGEDYRWGQEDFTGPYPLVWDRSWWDGWLQERAADPGSQWTDRSSLPSAAVDQMDQPLTGPYNRRGYQVYGPDPYYDFEERSALLNADWVVTESLSLSAGIFYTEQESEEFAVQTNLGENYAFGHPNLRWRDLVAAGILDPSYTFTIWDPMATLPDQIPIHRGIAHYWRLTPQDGDSLQTKISAAYELETPFIGGEARHTLLIGRQDIRNEANIWTGGPGSNDIFRNSRETLEESPVHFHSFMDWGTPLRYQEGKPMVIPSGTNQDYTTTTWETGHYIIYNGRFFQERLTLIGGWRHDRYQAKETRWHHEWRDMTRYGPGAELPPPLTDSGEPRISGAETYYNFVDEDGNGDAVTLGTWSYGLTYAITDDLSVYAVSAQGVLPNTGIRDANYDAIDPEETRNLELGLKFDLLDNKIAGTISVYQVTRENAIWSYANAPNPSSWYGGRDTFAGSTNTNPGAAIAAGVPQSYGFNYHLYFKPLIEGENREYWMQKLGLQSGFLGRPTIPESRNESVPLDGNGRYDPSKTPNPGKILHITRVTNLSQDIQAITQDFMPYVFIDYNAINPGSPNFDEELYAIAQQAIEDYKTGNHPEWIEPLGFGNAGQPSIFVGASASQRAGGNVTFEEEVKGVDLNMVISPTRNFQFTLNYSHVNREASEDFNLVMPIPQDRTDVENFATQYDLWVLDFGEEAFEDPTDPTTLKGGITGKSLYYGSEDTFTTWGRYTFNEGPLDGLGFGLGAIYRGPAQTFIPIGNRGSTVNRYPTPDTEGYWQFNGAIYYNRSFDNFDLRLQLNINNITDKDRLYSESSYTNPDTGEEERRRTERYLMPRHWRLSCALIF